MAAGRPPPSRRHPSLPAGDGAWALIDEAPAGAHLRDADGLILYANRFELELIGHAEDEYLGRPFHAVYADRALADDLQRRVLAGETVHDLEVEIRRRDGGGCLALVSCNAQRDDQGALLYVRCFTRDITARRADEQRLRENAERLRWLIENTSDAVWRFELEQPMRVDLPEDEQLELMYRHGWLADANEAMARMYGFPSAKAMLGMRVAQLLVRDDPRNELFLRAFVRSGYRLVDAESVDQGADGRLHYVLNSLVGEIRDGLGYRAWGTSRDITERKLAELALRESEERSRLALAAADVGTWDLDVAAGVARLSARAAEILGTADQEADGRQALTRHAHADDRERVERAIERAFDAKSNGEFSIEFRQAREGAAERWIAARGRAFFDERGRPARFTGTLADISGRKAIQEALHEKTRALERANVELARSNTELEQYAWVASHDLQEPLRMVVNYLHLLERRHPELLQGKPGEYVKEAVDGARRMQALVRGLLDYSRAGASHAPERVRADEALDLALANLAQKIAASSATVRRRPLPEVLADRVLLAQVFQNLIANAIKFARGAPVVEVSSAERDGTLIFLVADNGIGIDPSHQGSLFQIFRRLHARHEYPGTGIGLATVKKIIERHGGSVWLESTPGEGSTFFFSLPLPPAAAPVEREGARAT